MLLLAAMLIEIRTDAPDLKAHVLAVTVMLMTTNMIWNAIY
jgi:hypothetical protein